MLGVPIFESQCSVSVSINRTQTAVTKIMFDSYVNLYYRIKYKLSKIREDEIIPLLYDSEHRTRNYAPCIV